MNKKKFLLWSSIIIIFSSQFFIKQGKYIENLDIPIGVGFDMDALGTNTIEYKVPLSVYVFGDNNKTMSTIREGLGKSMGETREDRQTKADKKFILGCEKAYIVSESAARKGILNIIDIIFSNSQVNDQGFFVVSKQSAKDILEFPLKGYTSSADFIEGLLDNLKEHSFFSDQFKFIDVLLELSTEGRSIIVPYIELTDSTISVTGCAIFNKDKMIEKLNLSDTKILNLLRENNTKGMLTLNYDNNNYININCNSKKNIKCTIEQNKNFDFVIHLDITGELVSNTMNNMRISKIATKEAVEKVATKNIEQSCNDFISKMQRNYKTDFLELGRVAVSKYGHHKKIDWNTAISNSNINVIVNFHLINFGRGDF